MDTNIIFGFVGILVSIALFLFGYRQTIGARKEKILAANSDIEKTLLRRIILESYCPSVPEISRLLEAKERDYNLRIGDLYSERQVLTTIFARIVETDFIDPERRKQILGFVTPILVQTEEQSATEAALEYASENQQEKVRTISFWVLAVFAVTLGSLIAASPSLFGSQRFVWSSLLMMVATISVTIIIIATVYRLRESQEESTSSSNGLRSYLDFENEVLRELKMTGAKVSIGGTTSRYDFLIELRGKKMIIEVKAWSRRASIGTLRGLIDRLNGALSTMDADEAIIVTKTPVDLPPKMLESGKIRLMTLNQLRNYLVHEDSK